MANSILTSRQQLLLSLLSSQKEIQQYFYLTGGTALAAYYLQHRYSEDLDFFSMKEINPMAIQTILKKVKKQAGLISIDFQQSFNRNLFFLHFSDEIVKTEFTYFPFEQIEKPHIINSVTLDSLVDIAVNKTFTIYQKPRSRDFIDLYMIIAKENWIFDDLIKKAHAKFDTYLDPLQLGQQLLQVTELKDYPRMITDIENQEWQTFWLTQAKGLKKQALK